MEDLSLLRLKKTDNNNNNNNHKKSVAAIDENASWQMCSFLDTFMYDTYILEIYYCKLLHNCGFL